MASIASRSLAFVKRILQVVVPFGKTKLVVVVATMIIQAVLQLGGVASVLPFLSVAADPEGFANSGFGRFLVSNLQLTDPKQLIYVTGTVAIIFLVVASASAIASQVIVAKYVAALGHWLRMQLLSKYYTQPYAYFVSRNSAGTNKEGKYGRLYVYRVCSRAILRLSGTPFHNGGNSYRPTGA